MYPFDGRVTGGCTAGGISPVSLKVPEQHLRRLKSSSNVVQNCLRRLERETTSNLFDIRLQRKTYMFHLFQLPYVADALYCLEGPKTTKLLVSCGFAKKNVCESWFSPESDSVNQQRLPEEQARA